MSPPHPHFGTKPCFRLVCCGGQCPDPHHWCRFSHQFLSSHQLLAQPTVQRIIFLSTSSHVTRSSIPTVKLIQQPHQHMERLGPVLAVNHTSQAMFIHTYLQDSSNVLLYQNALCCAMDPPYSGLHKVIACMEQTSQLSMHGSPSLHWLLE